MIKMIAAVADNGVIGLKGKIPWDLPEDRRVFKELTMGNTLIIGRTTYESIGKPLPGRETIVVTSNPDYLISHGNITHDAKQNERIVETEAHIALVKTPAEGTLISARDIGRALCVVADRDCFFCGGERIYAEGLKYTEVLYLTRVELTVDGDRFFPADFEKDFHLINRERLSANCTLMTYVR
ncbi:MAG: dihydrofolate reductase [Eubacterium sp.]|nr:dihydrofolate reductase [Eubacterium sp.]